MGLKLWLALLLSLLIPNKSFGAIAYQTSNYGTQNTTTSVTVSITVSAGSNLYLVAGGSIESTNCGGVTFSATWNGTAMTALTPDQGGCGGSGILYLANPETGTHDLIVTSSITANERGMIGGGIVLTGVSQSAPEANAADPEDATDGCDVSVTSLTDNALVVGVMHNNVGAGSSDANGTNQTDRWNAAVGSETRGAGSTQTTTTAGSYTSSWSGNGFGQPATCVVASLAAAAGGAAAPSISDQAIFF